MKYNELNNEEKRIILNKGTEAPFSGEFCDYKEKGFYYCKQCNQALYRSSDKFDSNCGWPSFDDDISGSIKYKNEDDGRVEISCSNCGGHLGHIFKNERFTDKNTRHCVNSISLDFIEEENTLYKKAYFAGGCFWGIEYKLDKQDGVLQAKSGYMGGESINPSYEEVCSGLSGHLEVVEVLYDDKIISYENLVQLFFKIHDPEQENGQGVDIGSQYLSAIFYQNKEEKDIIEKIIKNLEDNKYKIATKLIFQDVFYEAEQHHQSYYKLKEQKPY